MDARPTRPLLGRGALSNPAGRFEREQRVEEDDGWYREEQPSSIATSVAPERARSIVTVNDSPDIPFDYSINPYRGCEHGCIYCYARPSHAYAGLSAGLDFETRLFYKEGAAERLHALLARRSYRCKPIMLGANTDPYQPIERRLKITRGILEVLAACRHPVAVITKGALILRDLDLLRALARDGLVSVMVSITTLDPETKRTLEPRAASAAARLRVVGELAAARVPVGVMAAPVIPAITDHELERILEAAAAAGAGSAGYVMLRLPHEVKALFREWLAAHHPDRAKHVMSLVQSLRGGRDNDPRFGTRMRGEGAFAALVQRRFALACRRLGLNGRGAALSTAHFRPPAPAAGQLSLL